jgi:hypothetical protein
VRWRLRSKLTFDGCNRVSRIVSLSCLKTPDQPRAVSAATSDIGHLHWGLTGCSAVRRTVCALSERRHQSIKQTVAGNNSRKLGKIGHPVSGDRQQSSHSQLNGTLLTSKIAAQVVESKEHIYFIMPIQRETFLNNAVKRKLFRISAIGAPAVAKPSPGGEG